MALEDLTPAVRVEAILNGDEITPANRLEYFLQKAATELPKPAAGDAGKVLTVNENSDGVEWVEKNSITVTYANLTGTTVGSSFYIAVPNTREPGPDVEYVDYINNDFNYSSFYTFSIIPEVAKAVQANAKIYAGFSDADVASNAIYLNGVQLTSDDFLVSGVWTGSQWDSGTYLNCFEISEDSLIVIKAGIV